MLLNLRIQAVIILIIAAICLYYPTDAFICQQSGTQFAFSSEALLLPRSYHDINMPLYSTNDASKILEDTRSNVENSREFNNGDIYRSAIDGGDEFASKLSTLLSSFNDTISSVTSNSVNSKDASSNIGKGRNSSTLDFTNTLLQLRENYAATVSEVSALASWNRKLALERENFAQQRDEDIGSIEHISGQIMKNQIDLAAAEKRVSQLTSVLNKERREKSTLAAKIERAKKIAAEKDEATNVSTKQLMECVAELEADIAKQEAMEGELVAARAEVEVLRRRADSIQSEADKKTANYKQKIEQSKAAAQELQVELERRLSVLSNRLESARQDGEDMRLFLSQHGLQTDALQASLQDQAEAVEQKIASFEATKFLLREAEANYRVATVESALVRRKNDELRTQVLTGAGRIQSLEAEVARKEQNLEETKRALHTRIAEVGPLLRRLGKRRADLLAHVSFLEEKLAHEEEHGYSEQDRISARFATNRARLKAQLSETRLALDRIDLEGRILQQARAEERASFAGVIAGLEQDLADTRALLVGCSTRLAALRDQERQATDQVVAKDVRLRALQAEQDHDRYRAATRAREYENRILGLRTEIRHMRSIIDRKDLKIGRQNTVCSRDLIEKYQMRQKFWIKEVELNRRILALEEERSSLKALVSVLSRKVVTTVREAVGKGRDSVRDRGKAVVRPEQKQKQKHNPHLLGHRGEIEAERGLRQRQRQGQANMTMKMKVQARANNILPFSFLSRMRAGTNPNKGHETEAAMDVSPTGLATEEHARAEAGKGAGAEASVDSRNGDVTIAGQSSDKSNSRAGTSTDRAKAKGKAKAKAKGKAKGQQDGAPPDLCRGKLSPASVGSKLTGAVSGGLRYVDCIRRNTLAAPSSSATATSTVGEAEGVAPQSKPFIDVRKVLTVASRSRKKNTRINSKPRDLCRDDKGGNFFKRGLALLRRR